jgi:hypothetical protein
MKTLSIISALLCLLSSLVFGAAGIGGYFVLGVNYATALLYIALMVTAIMVSVNLYFAVQEES